MSEKWNLTETQWSEVMLDGATPETVARDLTDGRHLSWTDILLQYSGEGERTLDLGSGSGHHSAMLALHGRQTTLLDWSKGNIEFASRLFEVLRKEGTFCHADMTKPLPFPNNSFDTVFSCGVFEYFTRQTIERILSEAFRVSRKRVIIMVPNALSIAYRFGMWYMKQKGTWQWGGEVPSSTLKPYFRGTSHSQVTEFSVGARHSLDFLTMRGGKKINRLCTRLLNLKDHSKPTLFRQGYLLVTIAEKPTT